jgi:hypothetical protein
LQWTSRAILAKFRTSHEQHLRGLGGGGGNNDGVFHGVVLLKSLDELGDGGSLLTDGDVDAVKLLGLVVAWRLSVHCQTVSYGTARTLVPPSCN